MLLNQSIKLVYTVIAEGTASLCCPGKGCGHQLGNAVATSWEMLWSPAGKCCGHQLGKAVATGPARPGLSGRGGAGRVWGPSQDLARFCFVSAESSDGIETFPQNSSVGPPQCSQVENSCPTHVIYSWGQGVGVEQGPGRAVHFPHPLG